MAKNNIRSIRFDDEILKIVEGFKGSSFNEKFDNLVRFCFIRVPQAEARLKEIEKEIGKRQEKLRDINKQCRELDMLIGNLQDIKLKIRNAGDCADEVLRKLG